MTWSRRLSFGPAGQGWVKTRHIGISSSGCCWRPAAHPHGRPSVAIFFTYEVPSSLASGILLFLAGQTIWHFIHMGGISRKIQA